VPAITQRKYDIVASKLHSAWSESRPRDGGGGIPKRGYNHEGPGQAPTAPAATVVHVQERNYKE